MTIVLIAVLAYFVATGLLLRSVPRERPDGSGGWRWLALAAVVLHAGYHAMVAWRTAGGPDLHFYSALSLVALVGAAWAERNLFFTAAAPDRMPGGFH